MTLHTFKIEESSNLWLLEPSPAMGPVEPRYFVKWGGQIAKSKFKPMIVWGDQLDDRMPFEWTEKIGRAKGWKIPIRPLFYGSTISIKINEVEMTTPRGDKRMVNILIAAHIHETEPQKSAVDWLNEQVIERRNWFAGD